MTRTRIPMVVPRTIPAAVLPETEDVDALALLVSIMVVAGEAGVVGSAAAMMAVVGVGAVAVVEVVVRRVIERIMLSGTCTACCGPRPL